MPLRTQVEDSVSCFSVFTFSSIREAQLFTPRSVLVTLSARLRALAPWTANSSWHLLSSFDSPLLSAHSFTRPLGLLSQGASSRLPARTEMQRGCLKIKPYRRRCNQLAQSCLKGLSSLEVTCVKSLLDQLLRERPEGVALGAGCSAVDFVLFWLSLRLTVKSLCLPSKWCSHSRGDKGDFLCHGLVTCIFIRKLLASLIVPLSSLLHPLFYFCLHSCWLDWL